MSTAIEQAIANVAAELAGPVLTAAGLGPAVAAVVAAAIREVPEVVDSVENVIAAWRKNTVSAPSVAQAKLDFKDQSASLEAQLHPKG